MKPKNDGVIYALLALVIACSIINDLWGERLWYQEANMVSRVAHSSIF